MCQSGSPWITNVLVCSSKIYQERYGRREREEGKGEEKREERRKRREGSNKRGRKGKCNLQRCVKAHSLGFQMYLFLVAKYIRRGLGVVRGEREGRGREREKRSGERSN
jgi:hypothetical protein